jgi:diguanylate cyclase
MPSPESPRRLLVRFGLLSLPPVAAAGAVLATAVEVRGAAGLSGIVAAALGAVWVVLLPLVLAASAPLRRCAEANERLASRDGLTGVANRSAFDERLDRALATGEAVPLMIIDLDRFKEVNDRRGHLAGDALLRTVAARLVRAVRAGDVVARLGGDEFAVLLGDGLGPDALEALAARVVAEIAEPVLVRGGEVRPHASVGVAVGRPGERRDELVHRADAAMYAAKGGPAGYAVAPA